MRFLIVTAAVFACAAAAPSGALLAAPYFHGLHAAAPLAYVAAPIPAGDIQGAAIDAHVKVSDAVRQINDQAAETHGRAINAAEDHAWQAVNAAQVATAQIDGATANVAPVAARQLVGHGVVAPVVAAYSAPIVAPAISAYAAPIVAAPAFSAYSAPVISGIAGSHSVSVQSLSQTHPAPIVHAPVAYAAHGLAHAW